MLTRMTKSPDPKAARRAGIGCAAILVVATAIGIAIAATGGGDSATDINGMEREAYFACEDFIGGFDAAQTTQARLDLADTVNEYASQSAEPGISDGAVRLARVADRGGDDAAWQDAGDSFAQACLTAGWNEAN